LAYVVTPNLGEAEVLAGLPIRTVGDMEQAARRIHAEGARHVVVKGGHLDGPPIDVFFDGQRFQYFEGERIETTSLHGTGCTFASAIAAELAKGAEVTDAVRRAKAYITTAIRLAEPLGHGFGPTHHFGALYQQAARYDMLLELEEGMTQLRRGGIAALMPEGLSNLGLALPHATILPEVAAWEGGIVRVGEEIQSVGSPRFGASRQVATMILAAMHIDSQYRSAMNIRYGEDILQACQAAHLRLAPLLRPHESGATHGTEGTSRVAGIVDVTLGMETVPDIIYDLGARGQEAMVWVLGHHAVEVARKVLLIRHRLSAR
jgi:hydroxymethylpyrimidine/phosphomethylpyrimidine kinase